ncbi:hypothetical protein ABIE65_001268 [Constrictibacter sp. MBR-5]|jgi:hypothetical protein|uniref:YgaP family membrane protein n=1 Tax=Constrictibacter sp. MBR-5 TaxID=3156467 RepID=UPI003392C20D
MTRNVGTVDRIARVVIGLALLSMLFLVEGEMRWFGLLGLVAIGTAAIGWCPAYRLLGIRT